MSIAALVVAARQPVDAGMGGPLSSTPTSRSRLAIDAAPPNTTIVVAGGVHAEQLTISTDGITLVGDETQLIPPLTAEPNGCSGLVGTVA